jgi:hypothetical protein
MARQNQHGRYIISAGEIASFVVCPEAWRLKMIEKRTAINMASVKAGDHLHKQWAADLGEAVYFTRSTKIILMLIGLLLAVFALTYRFKL